MRPFFHLLGLRGGLVEPGVFQARERLRRFGSKTVSTKNGLSIVAVTGSSSLRDELPEFRRKVLEMISVNLGR
jgi:hypothetical protein